MNGEAFVSQSIDVSRSTNELCRLDVVMASVLRREIQCNIDVDVEERCCEVIAAQLADFVHVTALDGLFFGLRKSCGVQLTVHVALQCVHSARVSG
jgi:hypothetical protein